MISKEIKCNLSKTTIRTAQEQQKKQSRDEQPSYDPLSQLYTIVADWQGNITYIPKYPISVIYGPCMDQNDLIISDSDSSSSGSGSSDVSRGRKRNKKASRKREQQTQVEKRMQRFYRE